MLGAFAADAQTIRLPPNKEDNMNSICDIIPLRSLL
jgi:hypothetical protein